MCDSEDTDRIIIPHEKAVEIVRKSEKIYLRTCICRSRAQNCPPEKWEVCLLFEHASQEDLRDAHLIPKEKALSILACAKDEDLINQLFYIKNTHHVTEICNCCTCCCIPLHEMKKADRYEEKLRTENIAVTDEQVCIGCGVCQDLCFFEARKIEGNDLIFKEENCFGCGVCIDRCPEKAISLGKRAGHGIKIPDVQV